MFDAWTEGNSGVEHLSLAVGGVASTSAPGELPQNEKQVTNLRQQAKLKGACRWAKWRGWWFICRIAEGIQWRSWVKVYSYYSCCSWSSDSPCRSSDCRFGKILHIKYRIWNSHTFSLGLFDVTPITYRHLLLSTKRNENTPIFLGPVLIYYWKTFATYLFFTSSLVGLSSQLEGIRAFGTDGEKALSDVFTHDFGFSQRFTFYSCKEEYKG